MARRSCCVTVTSPRGPRPHRFILLWGELRPNVGLLSLRLPSLWDFVLSNPGCEFQRKHRFPFLSFLLCELSEALWSTLHLVEIHCLALDLMLSSNYFKTSLGERGRQKIEIISVSFVLSHNYFGNFQCIQTSF